MEFGGLNSKELDVIIAVLKQFDPLIEAVLFGSRAKGNYTRGSDVDLAVKGCTAKDVISISMKLNEETTLPYFFDIVLYETIKSSQLIEHIDRVGKPIYCKNGCC